ncbi:MAG TPA: mechanosensitive ion channel family protein [Blastocatellia bacterium]|nr:mechanosensitive ion channel family protein [Blastocatellia bacterium]
MNSEIITISLYLLAGGVISATLHGLIGIAQRAIGRRFASAAQENGNGSLSLQKLFFDWALKALRITVWSLYAVYALNLVLPETQTEFKNIHSQVWDRLKPALKQVRDHGLSAVVIIVVTIFLMRFVTALIKTVFKLYERSAAALDHTVATRRLQTLAAILRGVLQAIIVFIGMMTLLAKLDVPIAPILASAGVVGIAVGFGAQSLIKDLFAGFLILLEDQYNIGDTVKIGEAAGTVEQLTLRVTRIRGIDGSLTTIPNGSITVVSNMSKDWSRVVLDVEVSYEEDVDRAMGILLEIAQEMKNEYPREIIEDPTMQGIDKMGPTAVTLRLMVKTTPTKHVEIGRELRRRIKLSFEREGIKVPNPHQQLILSPPAGGAFSSLESLAPTSDPPKPPASSPPRATDRPD